MEIRGSKKREMEYIDSLVFRCKAGDDSAGEELIERFGGSMEQGSMGAYIGKFYKILRYGKVNYQDIDSRRFVSLFMKGENLKDREVPWYKDREMKEIAQKKIEDISTSIRGIPDDDLKQDLREIFFDLVNRYTKQEDHIYFTAYLYNAYKYYLERYIKLITKKERLVISEEVRLVGWLDEKSTDPQAIFEIHEEIAKDTPLILVDDELGNSWVRGLTCGEEFSHLTSLDRLILRMHYNEGIKDEDIGKKFNMHINTIYRRRTKAVNSVQERVAALIQEGFYE